MTGIFFMEYIHILGVTETRRADSNAARERGSQGPKFLIQCCLSQMDAAAQVGRMDRRRKLKILGFGLVITVFLVCEINK